MTFRAFLPITIVVILAFAGCGSSKLDSFPRFPEHKARLGTSVILADFLILKAGADTVTQVDIGATKATADTMLHFIQDTLNAKGYNVTARLLTSVGLSMDSTFTARVVNTSGFAREGEEMPLSIHPPFYLYQALRREPAMKSRLATVYKRLAMMEETDGGYPPMPEIVPLGKTFGGGLIFVFLGGGYEVSASAQQTGVKGPTVDELSKIGYKSVSQASLHMYVLDSGTGEVLWADYQVSKGGMMFNDKFIRMARIVLGDLP
jgi:hypothetical protein